ncbi:MAG: glycosyltransferase family protein [Acidimicrobiia bacterium]
MDRALIYSHDTYGLGHLRRCLRIAEALVRGQGVRHVLIASGSPRAKSFPLFPGVDVVSLPAVTKSTNGNYESRSLGLAVADVARIRGDVVRSLLGSFQPQLVLVDHSPIGMNGELFPLLETIAGLRTPPRLVLGMREIVDDAKKVADIWRRDGVWEILSKVYDAVLVYGDPVIKTTALELNLADRLPIPVEHVGYVAPTPIERRRPGFHRPSVVVTTGGGEDGLPILDTYLDFIETSPVARRVRSILMTGPFLPHSRLGGRADMRAERGVELISFSDQAEHVLSSADLALTMAGYNTVAELLAYDLPAILVPRVFPRVEQWLRATRLGAVANFVPVTADELDVSTLEGLIGHFLDQPPRKDHQLDLDGARSAARALTRVGALTRIGARLQGTSQ